MDRRVITALGVALVLIGQACTASPSPTASSPNPPIPTQTSPASGPSAAPSTAGLGSTTPGGQSQGPTTEPPATPGATATPEPPTAADLIKADVAAGKIDEPTSLLYRIFAMYGDPRLPAAYAAGTPTEDLAAIATAQAEVDQMPAEVAAQIKPFLVRPTDPTSVFHKAPASGLTPVVARPASFTGDALVAADAPVCGDDGWASQASASIPVTVWAACDPSHDVGDIARALTAIESVYGDEVSLMGDPIPDAGGPDEGGDSNIDIYLIDACVIPTARECEMPSSAGGITYSSAPVSGPAGAETSSGYILVYRPRVANPTDARDVIAHEFFHVLEYAHNEQGIFEGQLAYWMAEASAKWAEEVFVPDGRPKWVYDWFKAYQQVEKGLNDPTGNNAYKSFIWPYFMDQQQGPQAIASAWDALRGKVGFRALDTALAGSFSFESNFKDFALRAWNTTPPGGSSSPNPISPRFQDGLDRKLPTTAPNNPFKSIVLPEVVPMDKAAAPIEYPLAFPDLAEQYRVFGVSDAVQKLVVDFSKVAPSEAFDAQALLHYKDGSWKLRPLVNSENMFCRQDDDIDRVILVLDDHSDLPEDAITGDWTLKATAEPCSPGHFTVTLDDFSGLSRLVAAAGSFSGDAPIECDWLGDHWHASWGDPNHPVDHIKILTIEQGPPAYVDVIHELDQEGDWDISEADAGAKVNVVIDDKGKTVTITANARGQFYEIDLKVSCAVIQRFP